MSKAPSMPMYWDAYIADTTHLSCEEHGAYLMLLGAMWRRDGTVPDDDADNARILGLSKAKWRKMKARLADTIPNFIIEDGYISQKNLRKIWENTQEKIAKNKINGAKGGRAKSNNNNDLSKANATNSLKRKPSMPEPDPEPYKEDTNVSLSLVPTDSTADDVSQAIALFKEAAEKSGWPVPRVLSKSRKSALMARLRECGGIEGWKVAIEKAQASAHCCGDNQRGWVLTFDFITTQSSFAKLMEGNYDNRTNHNSPAHPKPNATAGAISVAARARRSQGGDLF